MKNVSHNTNTQYLYFFCHTNNYQQTIKRHWNISFVE